METKKPSNKKIIGTIIGLLALIGVFAIVYTQFIQGPIAGSKKIVIEMIQADVDTKTFTLHTDAKYLGEALDEANLIEGEEGDFGLFITAVDGVQVNPATQYWALSKSGEILMTGADSTPIADGDKFELTLTGL
jgi:hypothetical protein